MENNNLSFFDFCSGIGGGRLGLEKAGFKCVGRCDTSRLSDITYKTLFECTEEKNYGNIRKIDPNILPKFDLMIAGFPCQTFSVIGRKQGFKDKRGQIIFELIRILKVTRPKFFILENVKGLVTHNSGNTFKEIIQLLKKTDYDVLYDVLISSDYGVPQKRQRIYIIGFNKDYKFNTEKFAFPEKQKHISFSDFLVLDKEISDENKLFLLKYLENSINSGKFTFDALCSMENTIFDCRMNDLRIYKEYMPTLRSQRDGIYYCKHHKIYQLSGYEAMLFQGFGKEYADKVKDIISDRHLLMQAGNAMTVNVIYEIGKSLISFYKGIKI